MDEKLFYCCSYLIKRQSVNKLHSLLETSEVSTSQSKHHRISSWCSMILTPDPPDSVGHTNQISHQHFQYQMNAEEAAEQSGRAAARPG